MLNDGLCRGFVEVFGLACLSIVALTAIFILSVGCYWLCKRVHETAFPEPEKVKPVDVISELDRRG
jgi:hypothetical protein